MQKVFLYTEDETRVFLYPSGEVADPARVLADYPSIRHFPMLATYEGETINAMQAFGTMKSYYGIPGETPDDAALAMIEEIINRPPPEPETSPDEIAASAAVLLALANLPDAPQGV